MSKNRQNDGFEIATHDSPLQRHYKFHHRYPVSSAQGKTDILAVMKRIINTENKSFVAIDPRTRSIQRHNAMLAVLFESINLLVKHKYDFALVQRAIQHIRAFLLLSDPDLRYLSLEAVKGLCPLDPTTTGDDLQFVLQVEKALVHPEISLRRRALDVLFELCSTQQYQMQPTMQNPQIPQVQMQYQQQISQQQIHQMPQSQPLYQQPSQQTHPINPNFPPFDFSSLSGSEDEQKQQIGNYIYNIVETMHGQDQASKITGLIIMLSLRDLMQVVQKQDILLSKIEEGRILVKSQSGK
ncbi:hypothetical protein BLNAU_21300 [Blattamonas nauphoetae]|uniref:PABC domain-containing protein n=1 Tax=Blattamonas nauphoetae TaxID=2049346 RepID=A0ABQ9WW95_9EUKA|nr:hypothetical protein BLNAU_21300 [Blattamonas nauphoetae]